jgi:hypothetical protein
MESRIELGVAGVRLRFIGHGSPVDKSVPE